MFDYTNETFIVSTVARAMEILENEHGVRSHIRKSIHEDMSNEELSDLFDDVYCMYDQVTETHPDLAPIFWDVVDDGSPSVQKEYFIDRSRDVMHDSVDRLFKSEGF